MLISEITALGKPSILIPYPYASDNHQEYNARALEEQGAAIVILEKDLSPEVLLSEVQNLLVNSCYMGEMSMNSKNLGKLNANRDILKIINKLYKGKE